MDEQNSNFQDQGGIWVPPSRKQATPEAEPVADVEEVEAILDEPEAAPEPDFKDKYLRALADCENIRRRSQEQLRSGVQRANEGFLQQLLPFVDGFRRALDSARGTDDAAAVVSGLELVAKQLEGFLSNVGVEVIGCAPGDPFDPEFHEAMMRGEATDDIPEGHVTAVVEPGYTLHGRVLRPARVAVAAAPLDAEA